MSNLQRFQAEVKSVNKDTGAFDVILSTSSIDRDGEQIAPYAMSPLPSHITFDVDHEMRVSGTIGSGVPEYIQDGTALRVHGNFSSTRLAQMTRTLVTEGHIRTTSVAMRVLDAGPDEKTGVWTIRKAELLNGAFVAIPANKEAIVLAAKSFDPEDEVPDEAPVVEESTTPETPAVAGDEATPEEEATPEAAESTTDEVADSTEDVAAESEEAPVDEEGVRRRASAYQAVADTTTETT